MQLEARVHSSFLIKKNGGAELVAAQRQNSSTFCSSECELHGQLYFSRVADALAQEPVEIKQGRSSQRIHVILVVERVEHLDHGDQRIAVTKLERPHDAPIERNVLVVLPGRVAFASRIGCATRRRNGLWRMRLQAQVQVESAGKLRIAE